MEHRVLSALAGVAAVVVLAASPARGHPFSFLTRPTDQLGVPGYAAGTLVTPEGSLYTGWTELAFRFGPRLRPADATARSLAGGRFPVLSYNLRSGGVTYSVTVFSAEVANRPVNFVRVDLWNRGSRPARAGWGTGLRYSGGRLKTDGRRAFRFPRPAEPQRDGLYTQPGASFDAASKWAFAGNAVLRDGQALLLFPRAPRGVTRRLTLRPGGSGRPVTETAVFGEVDYRGLLAPGAHRHLDYVMPVVPVAPGTPAYATVARARFTPELRRVLAYWRHLYARAVQIHVPERKVDDTFYTSLANMALARYRSPSGDWIQAVNKLQYNAFWLRDAAVIAGAFDLAGLHVPAAQDLDYFTKWQQGDGLFISRPQQYDGFGEALWAIGRHAVRAHDRAFADRMLPSVQRALGWFESEHASEPLGLMPSSTPGDNELASGHITGDDFWAAAGLREAIAMARLAGRADLAGRWSADLRAFMSALRAQLAKAEAKTGGWIPPTLEAKGGEDWGNLWASYPEQVLPASSPAVAATLRHVRARFREGIATYLHGRTLHDYLGFRVFETELLRGEQHAVVNGLYSELAHTTATNGGFETGIRHGGRRELDENLAPHGWFAAEYVTLLRNMLVRENGRTLVLMGAVSPSWLLPGRRISLARAGTTRGRIAFTLRALPGGALLRWHGSLVGGTRLRWPLPVAARDVRAAGLSRDRRTITLPAATGRLRVRWRLSGPFPSFRETARRVLALYR